MRPDGEAAVRLCNGHVISARPDGLLAAPGAAVIVELPAGSVAGWRLAPPSQIFSEERLP
jgi:hypothetical protein